MGFFDEIKNGKLMAGRDEIIKSYMEEYPIARFYRDVAAFGIGAGTSEVMREIIAKEAIDR